MVCVLLKRTYNEQFLYINIFIKSWGYKLDNSILSTLILVISAIAIYLWLTKLRICFLGRRDKAGGKIFELHIALATKTIFQILCTI